VASCAHVVGVATGLGALLVTGATIGFVADVVGVGAVVVGVGAGVDTAAGGLDVVAGAGVDWVVEVGSAFGDALLPHAVSDRVSAIAASAGGASQLGCTASSCPTRQLPVS
jgi:hypothetical protein